MFLTQKHSTDKLTLAVSVRPTGVLKVLCSAVVLDAEGYYYRRLH